MNEEKGQYWINVTTDVICVIYDEYMLGTLRSKMEEI